MWLHRAVVTDTLNPAEADLRLSPVPRFVKLKDVGHFVTWFKKIDDFLPSDDAFKRRERAGIKNESILHYFDAFCQFDCKPEAFEEAFNMLSQSMRPSRKKVFPRNDELEWFKNAWNRSSATTVANITHIHYKTVPALALFEFWVANPRRKKRLAKTLGHFRTELSIMLRDYGREMPSGTGTSTELKWTFADGISDWQVPSDNLNMNQNRLLEEEKLASSVAQIIHLGQTLQNNPLCWNDSTVKGSDGVLYPAARNALTNLMEVSA